MNPWIKLILVSPLIGLLLFAATAVTGDDGTRTGLASPPGEPGLFERTADTIGLLMEVQLNIGSLLFETQAELRQALGDLFDILLATTCEAICVLTVLGMMGVNLAQSFRRRWL